MLGNKDVSGTLPHLSTSSYSTTTTTINQNQKGQHTCVCCGVQDAKISPMTLNGPDKIIIEDRGARTCRPVLTNKPRLIVTLGSSVALTPASATKRWIQSSATAPRKVGPLTTLKKPLDLFLHKMAGAKFQTEQKCEGPSTSNKYRHRWTQSTHS